MTEPLKHPRDLFSEDEQAELDRQLHNMAETSRNARLRFQETLPNTRLIYVNADAECDEALREIEEAYGRLADKFDLLVSIVQDLAKLGVLITYGMDGGNPVCRMCDAQLNYGKHLDSCVVQRARHLAN